MHVLAEPDVTPPDLSRRESVAMPDVLTDAGPSAT